MNSRHLHISPRMRSALQHPLPAAARPWRGVCVVANILETRALCTAYKVAAVIT